MSHLKIYSKWLVQASKHRYTHVHSDTSVELTQAHPNDAFSSALKLIHR